MRCSVAGALSVALLPLAVLTRPTTSNRYPVCIIGAGPAGLTIANGLQSKGYKTVVFEKQAKVGGKSQAHYENGTFHPLGAAFFSNASYPETLKVINASGVLSEPFLLAGSTREQYSFNVTTGKSQPLASVSAQFRQAVAVEIPRYERLWQTKFAPFSVPGFKKGVPEEFTVSGAEWFDRNNFTALPVLVVNPLALYGYGDIRVVPALYVLQYMTPDILTAFAGQHTAYLLDFHKMWVKWAEKSIKGVIHTNAEVKSIDRSERHHTLKYTRKDQCGCSHHEQRCSFTVMAFPPSPENLEQVGLDMSPSEEKVFSAVGVHNYFSAAVKLDLPYGVSYVAASASPAAPPPNNGEPVALLRLHTTSKIATSWSWGPYRKFESEKEARALAKSTLSKINKDPRNMTAASKELDDDDIRAFRKWDYFPHLDSPQLKAGYYRKFNALQGCENTFWASGFNGMETVEWAIRAGQDIVHSHF